MDDEMEGLAVLRGFSPDQLKLLRPLFTLFYHPVGTLLFQQGEPADKFFILLQGEGAGEPNGTIHALEETHNDFW